MTRERTRALLAGWIIAGVTLLAVVVPMGPATACSCAVTTTGQVAESASFAFVGSEVHRVDTGTRDFDSVLVTFAVDEWLSHSDGPSEFAAFTGHGGGDCGVGQVRGQVAVFVYGTLDDPGIGICGSIQPIQEAIAVFEGVDVPVYPVAFDEPPQSTPGGSSYLDLALPVALAGVVLAGAALGITRHRRTRTTGIE